MTTTSEFKYLDPDLYDPADYEAAEDFTVEEAMELWEQAAEGAFAELPAPGTTCEECSEDWTACTCKGGATYDSEVFFIHDDAEEIASCFLAAWEYSLRLPEGELPAIDRSSDIWHGITILVKDLEALPEEYREDILLVKGFVDVWAPMEETEED